jgi:hypothetical protein
MTPVKVDFNTYEASALLGLSETAVTDLAKAGHLVVANTPLSPLAKKRQRNVYRRSDLEDYAGRAFTDAEILSAINSGKASQRVRKELYDSKHERVRPRPAAQGTLGRSEPAPAEPIPGVSKAIAEKKAHDDAFLRIIETAGSQVRILFPDDSAESQCELAYILIGLRAQKRAGSPAVMAVLNHLALLQAAPNA